MKSKLSFGRTNLKFSLIDCPACDGGGVLRKVVPQSLAQARIKAGVSREKIADKLGVSAAYLDKVEKGLRNCTPKIEAEYARL